MFRKIKRILREYHFTLSGWRFSDIKNEINRNLNRQSIDATVLIEGLFDTIEKNINTEEEAIAFVSNLPPEETGIATFSFRTLLGCDKNVDVFCPVNGLDGYIVNREVLKKISNKKISVVDIRCFSALTIGKQYKKIYVAIGNSNHITYVWSVLDIARIIGVEDRIIAYVHDPVLLNLVRVGLGRKLINGWPGFPDMGNRDSSSFSGALRWAATT